MSYTKKLFADFAPYLFYVFIVFEIMFMISPAALYYYSAYGPVLNFLGDLPGGDWLTAFFLPHFSHSTVGFFNSLTSIGFILFFIGLIFFMICAGHIYFYKFTKRGAVTRGIYTIIRHPQYSALMLMGLGTLFIWPRFFILISYVVMLILYYLLARKEEKECENKFGRTYVSYKNATSMFLPGDKIVTDKLAKALSNLPAKPLTGLAISLLILFIFISLGFCFRNFSITTVQIHYKGNSATVATPELTQEEFNKIIEITEQDPKLISSLQKKNISKNIVMLNYIVPQEWILPDIPMDYEATNRQGHIQPADFKRNLYKLLFTKVETPSGKRYEGVDILKNVRRRIPLFTAYIDLNLNKVTNIKNTPATVLWGDIPTPIF